MKNQYLQMIRGVCIICVILIHSISKEINIHNNELNIAIRTIINFAVGVFVFLSGYFVKPDEIKKNMKTYYKRRAKRVLIPYIIWSIIYIFLFNFKYIKTFNIKKLINMFVLGNSSAQMYYIIVLLQLIAITPLLLKLANKNSKVINLFLLSITPIYTLINGFYNYYFHNNIYLYATLFLAWITFYYLGIIFKQKKIEFYKYRMVIILCGVILSLVFGIIINIFEYNNGLKYGYCVSQVKFTNSIYVLFVILTIVFMQNKINIKDFKANFISKIGDYSFGIYLIHYVFINIFKSLLNNFININILRYFLIAFLSLIFSICFIKVINKLTHNNKIKQYLGF